MTHKNIVVGTRGSELALLQAQAVIDALKHIHTSYNFSIKKITTRGDIDKTTSLSGATDSKAWFTAEIEQALNDRTIDIAIHSLKDLSPSTSSTLTVLPVLQREDARDVLISKDNLTLSQLKADAVIGTDSARRRALLNRLRPDIIVKSIRGNVPNRIDRLFTQEYDAIVLASAGLARLSMTEKVTEFFSPEEFVPAVGQGILAAQARNTDSHILEMLHTISDSATLAASTVEQAFLRRVGGGCKTPVGCYSRVDTQGIHIDAMLHNPTTGFTLIKKADCVSPSEAVKTATSLADKLLIETSTLSATHDTPH